MMVLGMLFRKLGWMDEEFASKMNKFVFLIPMPTILNKTVSSIGGMSTPMGLMAMGATFDFKKALGKIKPAVMATFMKLIAFVAVFLPVAVRMGFRREELVAILVMLGSATTVSSFVMSKNMGHEGTLSSTVVVNLPFERGEILFSKGFFYLHVYSQTTR